MSIPDRTLPHIGLEGHINPWRSDRSAHANAAFRRNVTFVNSLPMDIAIATRDGFRFILEKKNQAGESKLVVRFETSVDGNIKKQLLGLMNCQDVENSKELEIAQAVWSDVNPNAHVSFQSDVVRVEYAIPLELLKKFGGIVYLKDIDYAISIYGMRDGFYHPYSRAGEMIKGARDSVSSLEVHEIENGETVNSSVQNLTPNSANFIRSIKIIDNAGTIGRRWTKIGRDIFVIQPHKEPDMRDGVYVLTNSSVTNEMEKSEVVAHRYDSCEEIPHFKLHKSYLEALNDEVSAETRKFELAMRDLEVRAIESDNKTRRAELENERLMAERDQAQRDLEAEQLRSKHEAELLNKKIEGLREEQKTQRIREEEERKTLRRKGFVEFMKAVPVAITAVVGVWAFVQKTKSQTSGK